MTPRAALKKISSIVKRYSPPSQQSIIDGKRKDVYHARNGWTLAVSDALYNGRKTKCMMLYKDTIETAFAIQVGPGSYQVRIF